MGVDDHDSKSVEESKESDEIKDEPSGEASNKRKASWKDVDDSKNTSVYVSGLPTTMTDEEFIELMKKAGVIAMKPTPGNPLNIKLYKNKDGSLKGDGCCKYVRRESIDIAITRFDGYRYDDKHIIHCEKAKFEPKESFDPSKKPRIDPKAFSKQRRLEEKKLAWDSRDPPELRQKVVVLKNMFTIDELTDNPGLIIELRDELEQRCAKEIVGPKRVQVYDTNPAGIITITFNQPEEARACVKAFSSHFNIELWDGKTNYKIKETEEDRKKRLERFESDIQKSSCDDPELASE